ncbi:MAG: 3-hydroxyacyl-CoA dehydrogenase [Candidatus Obscuribacterales bacterium]|nr:3-hydroxyacyl-CoA dehydrogenase [Candidatus Obscuribacterales bacterium]
MPRAQIEKVAIIGAGTMGSSIALAVAKGGYPVLLKDINQEQLQSGLGRIEKFLQSMIKKGLSPAEAEAIKNRIQPTSNFSDLASCDLVIEAVLEKMEIKSSLFKELESHCRPDCLFATNTSSLSITEIASHLSRPERLIGLHFFNPAHLMKLVEVIPGLDTDEATIKTSLEFAAKLGKLAVRVEECASFLVNRLLGRYMTEALWCLEEGIADVAQIDKAACDYLMPIGPLALRDMNGADIGLAVSRFNYQEYGERFKPAPILEKMVELNWLGQKTGKGFYLYDPETKKRSDVNPELKELIKAEGKKDSFQVERLFLPMINEAFLLLQEHVCAAADLDPALMAGLGMRKGPLTLAQEIGLAKCLAELEKLCQEHGERFRPAPLLKRYVRGGRKSLLEPKSSPAAACAN